MSLSVKTQGGSGGFFPSIFVTGLSENDTVYAAKDGKTVRGKWDESRSGFLISPLREMGMWTVTATNGNLTKTEEVLVDVATGFEIELILANYKMLYYYGDECENATDGWGTSAVFNSYYNNGLTRSGTAEKLSNAIHLSQLGVSGSYRYVSLNTDKQIPLSEYTKMLVQYEILNKGHILGVYLAPNLEMGDASGGHSHTWIDEPVHVWNGEVGSYLAVEDIDIEQSCYVVAAVLFGSASDPKVNATVSGIALFGADDWQTLCATAGVSAPDALATLIADTTSIAAILASEDAVKYMVAACTGDFMASFVASSACLSALEASPYKEIVTANQHWAKFLAMVQ